MDTEEIDTFVNWPGNKQWIASAIKAQFPVRFSRYFEPFVGGGSVLLGLSTEFPRIIGDRDPWLIDTYLALRDRCDRVLEILQSLSPCREVFDKVRKIHPDRIGREHRAAHLIYLNKLCERNRFQLNRWGYFNVPFNSVSCGPAYCTDHLKRVSQALQGVEIQACDFEVLTQNARKGDFVYFDPPEYLEQYSFHRLRRNDYHRLSLLCTALDLRGVVWAVQDANTPMMRLLFSRFLRTPLAFHSRDQEINSLLFTNYSTPYHEPQKNSTLPASTLSHPSISV